MVKNVVDLHRVIKAPPEKVFKAFTEPLAIASWIPPYGFLCIVHNLDVKVGGTYKMSFINFSTNKESSWEGKYLEIKKDNFIKHSEKFDDPKLPGEMITSIWFKKVSCGTDLVIKQEGIPLNIPIELCYLGWQESLEKLIKLVEPVIPDG